MSAKILITGMANTGKCQSVNTPIPTPDGWKKLGELKVGDYVFSEDGRPTKIIGVFPQGIVDNYIIKFNDGTSTNCGLDHLWKVGRRTYGGGWKYRVMDLQSIKDTGLKTNSGARKFIIPLSQPVQYKAKKLEVHPYVLGVLIGDGCLVQDNMDVTSSLEDTDVQERCKKLEKDIWTKKPSVKERKIISRLTRDNRVTEYIKRVGLNVKSHNKFIPDEFMLADAESRAELLAGLLDTDGCCTKAKGARFYTKSEKLAKQVNELALSLGHMSHFGVGERDDKGKEYIVSVISRTNPFILSRKADKWEHQEFPKIYSKNRTIKEIQYNGQCEQVCIMVDHPSHTYLTENYIVTHNTTLLKTLNNVLICNRDGKECSLKLPHFNMPDYTRIDELLDMLQEKLETYKDKFGEYPATIAFDSVSRIFTDIETSCSRRYSGYEVWSNVNKEINTLLDAINELQNSGYNIVLVAHAVWDENAKKYIETCKGSFAKIGGFLSVVDYAINIDIVGKKYVITHRGNSLSRTLIESMPDKQDANEFNLQDYIDRISEQSNEIQQKWSI